MITIDDFAKVELRVGTVVEAGGVEGSEKLIKLTVDLGEDRPRTILTGMRTWYKPEYFQGKQIVVITNLEPRPMMGLVSEGMIVATDGLKGEPVLLKPAKKVPNGSKIR